MLKCEFCTTNYDLTQLSVLKCGHTFHAQCLPRCLEVNSVCPRCRAPVNKNDVIRRIFVDASEESTSSRPTPTRQRATNVESNAPDVDLVASLLEQNVMLRDAAQNRPTTNVRNQDTYRSRPPIISSDAQHLGVWQVNEKLSHNPPLEVRSHGDSTLVISTNRVDLFTHSTTSTNLVRKATTYIGDRFNFFASPYYHSPFDICLNSSSIVYRDPKAASAVVVFDLSTSRSVTTLSFDREVHVIITSGAGVFAVMLTNCEANVYRREQNDTLCHVVAIKCDDMISMSAKGIFSYNIRNRTAHPRFGSLSHGPGLSMYLYDAINAREMGTIVPRFDFQCCTAINDEGSLVAVETQYGLLQIIDVTTKQKIFQFETTEFGSLARNCFSSRFVAFRDRAETTILSLDGPPGQEQYTIPINDDDIFGCSPVFRKINGVHYFQYVTKDGTLKMYKFNEQIMQWQPVA